MKKRWVLAAALALLCSNAHAQISDFTLDTSPSLTDFFPTVHQACAGKVGCNYRVTLSTAATLIQQAYTNGYSIIGDGQGNQSINTSYQANVPASAACCNAADWIGNLYYPVTGAVRIGNGTLGIQAQPRGWGSADALLSLFANDPNGSGFCGGSMSCYVAPAQRSYGGQDTTVANMFNFDRLPLAVDVPISSVSSVTLPNGYVATQIHLTSASLGLPGTQGSVASKLLPLMRIELANAITAISWSSNTVTVTTAQPHGLSVGSSVPVIGTVPSGYVGNFTVASVPNSTSFTYTLSSNPGTATTLGDIGTTFANNGLYFGYTIASGLSVPIISSDGLTLTVDGFYNVAGTALSSVPSGSVISVDAVHLQDIIYMGWNIKDNDLIQNATNVETENLNNRTSAVLYSTYDPNNDLPLLRGFVSSSLGNITNASGSAGTAFEADQNFKRGLGCRNSVYSGNGTTPGTGVTSCVWNMDATYGLYSLAPTTDVTGTTYAFVVYPHDLLSVTATLTQAGVLSVQNLSATLASGTNTLAGTTNITGAANITGASSITNMNANLAQSTTANLIGQSSCTKGNVLFATDANNSPIDGTSTGSGAVAVCNDNNQWLNATTGLVLSTTGTMPAGALTTTGFVSAHYVNSTGGAIVGGGFSVVGNTQLTAASTGYGLLLENSSQTTNLFYVDASGNGVFNGHATASAYYAGGSTGVSCSGSPTSSFASVYGIVTHC